MGTGRGADRSSPAEVSSLCTSQAWVRAPCLARWVALAMLLPWPPHTPFWK